MTTPIDNALLQQQHAQAAMASYHAALRAAGFIEGPPGTFRCGPNNTAEQAQSLWAQALAAQAG